MPADPECAEPPLSDLFEELKRRHVIRTIVGYAAAVFVVLQVADLTFEAIGLPAWSYRFVVILSIVGFPVTAISAWLFDLRSGTLERTPDRPDGVAKRASPIIGVAVVVATVSVAALATWMVRSGPPVSGDLDDELIAVVPFRISASDPSLSYLREGVVDLLAAKLTDTPRVVEPRTLLTAWRERAGSVDADLPADEIVALAARLGAGRVLLGSVVGAADDLTMTASLRDVEDDRVVAETTIPGSAGELTVMIDALGARLLGAQAGVPVEQVTSRSLPAVREYLSGRAAYRAGNFSEAVSSFDRALTLDSTFAAAALGAIDASGMQLSPTGTADYRRLAWDNRARLSPDDQLYLQAVVGVNYPASSSLREQLEFVRDVAEELDRPEAWYQYGDMLFHWGHQVGLRDHMARAASAFRIALRQDPEFVNAALHLNWSLQLLGDSTWREIEVVEPSAGLPYLMETLSLSAVTDPEFASGLPERISRVMDSLSWNGLLLTPFEAFRVMGGPDYGNDLLPVADRATRRAIEISSGASELGVAYDTRWLFLANLGRWDEAVDVIEEMGRLGPGARRDADRRLLEGRAIWEGEIPPPVLRAAAERLTRMFDETTWSGTTPSPVEVESLCVLALYLADTGDPDRAREIGEAMRSDAEDAVALRELQASTRRTCTLLLDARLAEDGRAAALQRLSDWLDVGPPGNRMRLIANLEAARMWEEAGNLERTWAHGRRSSRGAQSLEFLRPFHRIESRASEVMGVQSGEVVLRPAPGAFDWEGRTQPAGSPKG